MPIFKGAAPAMITPMTDSGIDYAAFESHIERMIAGNSGALVVLGTTGEPSTMTAEERTDAIKFTLQQTRGRVPVIVGTGSNNTAEAVKRSVEAEKLGADALLVVTPYYNKCTQNGLIQHYKAIGDSVGIPMIIYNVPTRTKVNILPETAEKMCGMRNISGIKEASGDIDQILEMARVIRGGMDFYMGDDSLAVVGAVLGAVGLISVASNVIPDKMSELMALCFANEYDKARDLQFQLAPLMKALFCEVNPIPAKKALQLLGHEVGIPRLPLTEMEPQNTEKMARVLKDLGLIK